jgi:hypothetical protein
MANGSDTVKSDGLASVTAAQEALARPSVARTGRGRGLPGAAQPAGARAAQR